MYILRDYQNNAVNTALRYLKFYKNPFILVLPTGSGKSLVIANIVKQINEPVLVFQPTKEILEQNYSKLLSYGVNNIALYSASVNSKEIDKFTYATIGSVYRCPEKFKKFKYVIVDECHLVNPKNLSGMYNQFFNAIGSPQVIGLTATPYRLIQKYYREGEEFLYTAYLQMINRIYPFFFKKIAHNTTNKELTENGFLAPIEYITRNKEFDSSKIKINTTGADFDSESLDKYINARGNVLKISSAVNEFINRKHILVFCSSIRHANNVKDCLLENFNIESQLVTSKLTKKEREIILDNFRSGKTKVVINVGVLTIGFDFPSLDTIILGRPTLSLALFYQCIGRGIRPDPGYKNKKCLVVDITDNLKRMGRIETIKITKEADGFRDRVETEMGVITDKPLFTFRIKKEDKIKKIFKQEKKINNKKPEGVNYTLNFK